MTTGVDIPVLLQSLPLFRNLSADLLAIVAAEVGQRSIGAGEIIFRLGEAGTDFFIVLDGGVQIYLPTADGSDDAVAELTRGRWFGEMALITGEPRSASARTTTATTLLALSRSSFQSLLTRVPGLALTLSHELSSRLRTRLLQQPVKASERVLVLEDRAPSAATAQAVAGLAVAIAEELDQQVAVIDLSSTAAVPASLLTARGRGAESVLVPPPATANEISALSESFAIVVVRLTAEHPLSAAVRGMAGARLLPDVLERAADVVGQEAPGRILASPIQQLARQLLHRRVGLVFGAGAAKGMAHIGAVRAFEAAHLRFDMVAGTSIGGCLAAMLAMGWDSDVMLQFAQRLRDNFRKLLLGVGMPSGSLLRGHKKRRLLQAETNGRTIEDLPVPYWTVAADLVSGREIVFDRGPLWEALDATTAIPTVFPPVTLGDRVLVDGWVVNPFPSDVLRRKGANIVIGVDPNLADEPMARRSNRPRRSRWRKMLDVRRLIDPAGIVQVAMRAMDVGARERTLANLALADVCVQPALGAYSITDIQKLDAIVAAGEAAADPALPAIVERMQGGHRATRHRQSE